LIGVNTAARLREAPVGDNTIRASLPSGGIRPAPAVHPCGFRGTAARRPG